MSELSIADVLNELQKGHRAFKAFEKGIEVAEFLSKADDILRQKKAEVASVEAEIEKAKALLSPLAEKVKAKEQEAAQIVADAKAKAEEIEAKAKAKAATLEAATAEKVAASERAHALVMDRFAKEEAQANANAAEAKAAAEEANKKAADANRALAQAKAALGVG